MNTAIGIPEPAIPQELIEQVAAGNVVLILGEAVSCGAPGEHGLPRSQEIIDELASRCGFPDNEPRTFPRVCSYYEASKDRQSMVELFLRRYGDVPMRPLRAHRAVARLPLSTILTITPDNLIEHALEESGRPVIVLVVDTDLPYQDPSKTLIFKLRGTVRQHESLVLTEADQSRFLARLPGLFTAVQSQFASKTLLYVGDDLYGEFAGMFYQMMIHTVDRHQRRSYAAVSFTPAMAPVLERQKWSIIVSEPTGFLEALAQRVDAFARHTAEPIRRGPLPDEPYKFLDYFEASDAAIFFGRDIESLRLTDQVESHKLTVLFGPSGVGKSSLLNAGLAPRLRKKGYTPLYLRALTDPVSAIKRAVWDMVKTPAVPIPDAVLGLQAFLELLLPIGTYLVILLDQFEEFFLRFGAASRSAFAQELADCLRSDTLDVRVVLALREDYFALLHEMEPPLRSIYANRLRLDKLNELQATDAIIEPAAAFGLQFEDKLVVELLEDLETGGIEPAQLQIVCYHLYRKLACSQQVISREAYTALGGTGGILKGYIDTALASLESEESLLAAKSVLKTMVTSERTKAALSAQEITRDAIVRRAQLTDAEVTRTLKLLQDLRLVRRLRQEDDAYELSHEVMVEKVWEWIDQEDVVYKYLQQILRQGLTDFRQFGSLLEPSKYRLLKDHREVLSFTLEECNLVLWSALTSGDSYDIWIGHAQASGIDPWDFAKEILLQGLPRAKHTVLNWVEAQEPTPKALALLELALISEYPALGRQARRALVRVNSQAARAILDEHPAPDDMVLILDGEFVMGDEDGLHEDERPAHTVYLDEFLIDRYPVTNLEYKAFVDATGREPPTHWVQGRVPPGKEDHPVVSVSWFDAQAYAAWAGKRLVTEAEWEKAASWDPRTKKRRKFPWGDEFDPRRCNSREGGPDDTTPVGQYSPVGGDSAYGVSDMSGNVIEWTADWYDPHYYQRSPRRNPQGPNEGDYKVLRGGSWAYYWRGTRTAARNYDIRPTIRNLYAGFRCAKGGKGARGESQEN